MRCKGTKADGEPCGAPDRFVDDSTGYCPSHGPGASEKLSEWGRKGGSRSTKEHLREEDLPPLDSPQAASQWLETVGRAVACGTLTHNEGKAVARLIREWLRTRDAGEMEERMEELEGKLDRLKSGKLEAIS